MSGYGGQGGGGYPPPQPGGNDPGAPQQPGFPANNGVAPVTATAVAVPTRAKAPPDPALSKVIMMATDAVQMDNAGRFKEAKQSYMFAAQELIRVCRASTDPQRQYAYKKRADTYLKRAEALDRMLRQKIAEKRRIIDTKRQQHWFLSAIGKEVMLGGDAMTMSPTQAIIQGKKIVCVFVGANWDENCRNFLPELQKFYTLVAEEHPGELEIIYASGDRTQNDFDALYKAQSWPCIPFRNKQQVGLLLAHCKFYGRKYGLVVLDGHTGKVLVRDGAPDILKSPSTATFQNWVKLLP